MTEKTKELANRLHEQLAVFLEKAELICQQNCGTGYCGCIECVMDEPAQEPTESIKTVGFNGLTKQETDKTMSVNGLSESDIFTNYTTFDIPCYTNKMITYTVTVDTNVTRWYLNGKQMTEEEHSRAMNPIKEHTIAEIEKLLGYSVKVIK